jgi:hypothetical protein
MGRRIFFWAGWCCVLTAVLPASGQTGRHRTEFLGRYLSVTIKGAATGDIEINVTERDTVFIAEESGKSLGFDSFTGTRFAEFKRFTADITDTSGKMLRRLKKDDILESTASFESVYHKHNTKYHQLVYPDLPYIVRRSVEGTYKSAVFMPEWDPQSRVDVLKAGLEVIFKEPFAFRYVNIGGVQGPSIWVDPEGFRHYRWTAAGIPKFVREYRTAPESEMMIGVRFFPDSLSLEDVRGSGATWPKLGDWFERLFRGGGNLSSGFPELEAASNLEDSRAKVRSLFRYLQNKTRYVSIVLGLDGFRPHPVDDVHRLQYGDCKDLSAYMIAMLKRINVESYPALVLTRDEGVVDPSLPGDRFNHCITMVPINKDTLWLECTSDAASIERPPPNLQGVQALILKPGESRLVRIPVQSAEANSSFLSARAELLANRDMRLSGSVVFRGAEALHCRGAFMHMTAAEQRDWLSVRFSAGSGDVTIQELSTEGQENPDTTMILRFKALFKLFSRTAGNRMLFQPRLFHAIPFDGEPPGKRRLPLFNPIRYLDRDSIRFVIPPGFRLQADSLNLVLDSRFGRYQDHCETAGDGFFWSSSFLLRVNEVPLTEYPEYYNFMKKVQSASQKSVMVRN